jgi:hypothetical protein
LGFLWLTLANLLGMRSGHTVVPSFCAEHHEMLPSITGFSLHSPAKKDNMQLEVSTAPPIKFGIDIAS